MRSFQVCRCGEPMQFAERIDPKPAGSEVLLKVLAAGVCHSDLHIWEGFYDLGGGKMMRLQDRGVKLPLTMGHENVGEVVAVGPKARGVKIGDKRLVYPWIGCGSLRGMQARRRAALHGAALPRRLSRRRLCRPSVGAASALSVDTTADDEAGAGGAARLLGPHRLWRAEEARPAWSRASRWW